MSREASYYNLVMNEGRVRLSELRGPPEAGRAALFIDRARQLAGVMDIRDFPNVEVPQHYDACTIDIVSRPLFAVEQFLNGIYARNVFILDQNMSAQYISLDETWRSRVSTLLTHVREIVRKADIEERLRASINQSLNSLQTEVDRTQTRVAAASDVLIEICDGIGQGAEALKPAAKLFERIVGAFRKAQKQKQDGGNQASLPSPDILSLPSAEVSAEADE